MSSIRSKMHPCKHNVQQEHPRGSIVEPQGLRQDSPKSGGGGGGTPPKRGMVFSTSSRLGP